MEVRATRFLHGEYETSFFWWEPIALLQRLILTGFVLLIKQRVIRVFVATLVSLLYFFILLLVRPYRRDDLDAMSSVVQFCLLSIYVACLAIKLFQDFSDATSEAEAHRVTGFASTESLMSGMFVFVFLALVPFIILTFSAIKKERRTQEFRVARAQHLHSGERPMLSLYANLDWHLFLSHGPKRCDSNPQATSHALCVGPA